MRRDPTPSGVGDKRTPTAGSVAAARQRDIMPPLAERLGPTVDRASDMSLQLLLDPSCQQD